MGTTKKSRRKFSNEFKAKVCIEALKEQKTLSELAVKYELYPGVISNWKTEFLNKASGVFGLEQTAMVESQASDELYKRIGQLEMENQFLKKNLVKLGL